MNIQNDIDTLNFPTAFTHEFLNYIENWDVVIVWDKDHTMVDPDNVLRPKLERAILELKREFPSWKHVILTENSLESTQEMFDKCPSIRPVFDMLLCDDNFFSRKAIRRFFREKGHWWVWSYKLNKERARRKKRRVHDLFLGKKVVLIDDLRDGRIPEYTYCVTCKLWTGEISHKDELDWPETLRASIIRILKQIYGYSPRSAI